MITRRPPTSQMPFEPPPFLSMLRGRIDGRFAIEHAELEARMSEWLTVAALSRSGRSVVITRDVPRCRAQAYQIIRGRTATRTGGTSSFIVECGPTTVWFVDPGKLNRADAPFALADALFVAGAESIPDPPFPFVPLRVGATLLLTGSLADRDHWWYEWARATGIDRSVVTAGDVVAAYPEQGKLVLPESNYRYARAMLVKDEPPRSIPFEEFGPARLKIKTEKPINLLSPKQRAEAEKQMYGGVGTGAGYAPIVSFEFSAMNIHYQREKEKGRALGFRKFTVLKGRRQGITTYEQGESYATIQTRPNSIVGEISTDKPKVLELAEIFFNFVKHDPESRVHLVNKSRITPRFSNGAWCIFGSAETDAFGRGGSYQRIHCSEVAYWKQGPRHMDEMARFMVGIYKAAANGEVVKETTANGYNWFKNDYDDAKKRLNDSFPIFLPWFADAFNRIKIDVESEIEAIVETLDDEEKDLIARVGIDHEQIAWRRGAKLELGKLFRQECPEDDESCFLAAGTCWFDVDRVVALQKKIPDYARQHVPGGYYVEWEEPIAGVEYVIGSDTSEGLGGSDRAGHVVLRRDTGAQVAALHGLFRPAVLANLIAKAGRRYNYALAGVERENHGHAVLVCLMQEEGYQVSHLLGGNTYFSAPDRPGWSTNETTRPIMINELAAWIEAPNAADVVRDRDLLGECLTFRLQVKTGKFEADAGAFDDNVMKNAVARQMLKTRKRTFSIG